MRAPALVLLVLLLVSLVPTALADHTYSHRYVVYGRVVDALGAPVEGVQTSLAFDVDAEGLCADQPMTETDAWGRTTTRHTTDEEGWFLWCAHIHEIPRDINASGLLTVPAHDYETLFLLDVDTRVTFLLVELGEANITRERGDYTVAGRLWMPGPTTLDGVPVYGTTYNQKPVDLAVRMPDGTTVEANATTNRYGDFAVRVPGVAWGEGEVEVRAENHTFTGNLTRTGVTFLKMDLGTGEAVQEGIPATILSTPATPTKTAPPTPTPPSATQGETPAPTGQDTPLLPLAAVVGLVAASGFLRRRAE